MRGVRRRLNEACRLPRSPVSRRGLSEGWSVKEEGRKEAIKGRRTRRRAGESAPRRLFTRRCRSCGAMTPADLCVNRVTRGLLTYSSQLHL